MHILILGGSGRTGQLIIDEALSKGYTVTALVRSSSSLKAREGLVVVEGTPLSASDVAAAFMATPASVPSAVVVALNARRESDSPFAKPSADTPPRMMADSVANAAAAMKLNGARRLVVMSSQGTGDSLAKMNIAVRLLMTRSNMAHQFADHNAVDAETKARAADLDFTLVRPVRLAEGPAAAVKVFPDDGAGTGLMSQITRASVAKFIVDAVENADLIGRTPVVSN